MTENKKRGRKAKSSFYHARWNKVQININKAAEILGVTPEEVEEFDRTGNTLAERYLLLWDKKHVQIDEWKGWYFSRGFLIYRGQRFTAKSILEDKAFRESLESETRQIMQMFNTQTRPVRLEDASDSRPPEEP